ncbi:hypothetical protein [Psychrobacter lutiphocae]|uniref:hypothetical protein n=1 Tax=Psychrobacter lutiphocae TaxID=540500 RepID=UPI00037A0DCB|nr:hypothetical protein [Psychrobacter lutiphocae]
MPATRLPCTAQSTHSAPAAAKTFATKASTFAAKPLAALLLLACTTTLIPMTAMAVTETYVAASDPQVAPAAASPFNQTDDTNNNGAANPEAPADMPNALDNPDSLASNMQPSDADLSAANQELLSRNAQLQRDVNDLETQVNVLINERSGQLFMYGAVTVAVSFILGLVLGGFIFSRRERW